MRTVLVRVGWCSRAIRYLRVRHMIQRRRERDSRRSGGEDGGDEFEQKVLDLSRVTRVTAGGKRMRFRACVAVGDRKGHVGIGLAKGLDVSSAISKATTKAKKGLVEVPIVHDTIPYDVIVKFKAAKVLLKPAPKGTGIIASTKRPVCGRKNGHRSS